MSREKNKCICGNDHGISFNIVITKGYQKPKYSLNFNHLTGISRYQVSQSYENKPIGNVIDLLWGSTFKVASLWDRNSQLSGILPFPSTSFPITIHCLHTILGRYSIKNPSTCIFRLVLFFLSDYPLSQQWLNHLLRLIIISFTDML